MCVGGGGGGGGKRERERGRGKYDQASQSDLERDCYHYVEMSCNNVCKVDIPNLSHGWRSKQ